MHAEHQVLKDYGCSFVDKTVGYSLCMNSKNAPGLEEELSFSVEDENRVSNGETALRSKVTMTTSYVSRVLAFMSLFHY